MQASTTTAIEVGATYEIEARGPRFRGLFQARAFEHRDNFLGFVITQGVVRHTALKPMARTFVATYEVGQTITMAQGMDLFSLKKI